MNTLRLIEEHILKIGRRRKNEGWILFNRQKDTVAAVAALASMGLVDWTIEKFRINDAGLEHLDALEHAKGFQTTFIPED